MFFSPWLNSTVVALSNGILPLVKYSICDYHGEVSTSITDVFPETPSFISFQEQTSRQSPNEFSQMVIHPHIIIYGGFHKATPNG